MYYVSAQGVDERTIKVHCYGYYCVLYATNSNTIIFIFIFFS